MKKLCGVTKKEVVEGYVFGVEIEYNDGHRHWRTGNFAECNQMAEKYAKKGMLSDFDSMCTPSQPEHLKEIAELWYNARSIEGTRMTMNELFDKYGKE